MIDAPRRAGRSLQPPNRLPELDQRARIEPPAGNGKLDTALARRIWLIACCLLLVALAFVDRPGNIVADTKLDLAVNPAGFLARALHLWDPSQFGQLQNQASGYLFPMGPFFLAGKLIALPPWVVQRLWIAGVALAAFTGAERLAGRLGIGTPQTRIAAGFAYALAPKALMLLGTVSAEFLPAAMLPWIVLPLVTAVQQADRIGASGRARAAARSAVAVALCSGNNAASVVAMLTGAAIYLITAPRSAQAWRIAAWWVPAVLLATVWWLYPLLLLGKYGVSFLPYTESAAVTTSVTSLSNSLRGTEDWLSYLVIDGHRWWPVGFTLSTGTIPVIMTGLVAGLGLTGLLGRGMPARRYLLCSVLAGVFIIGAGYLSGLGSPLAGMIDHALNGALAPMRNLHKFDPLIRLPVALGLAQLLAHVRPSAARKAVSLLAAAALAIIAFPAFEGGLSASGDFPAIPQYWTSAVRWLDTHAGNQAVLAVPGARFGEYTWGRPMDDVLEALYKGDWASRQLNAIGSVGNVRLLQAIDQQLTAGQGSAGLSRVLARIGVKYILVRNDLIRDDLSGAWPARIHQALGESPGIVKVAQFGPVPVGSFMPNNAVSAFDTPYPPVEVYRVIPAQPVVTQEPAAGTLRVYGGPEALLTMASAGLLRNRPVLINSDPAGIPVRQSVVTDSLRRRTRDFGDLRSDFSATLTASDPARTFAAADDFLEPSWRRYLAVARYYGIANVTASSSDAGITAIPGQSATGRLPFAAVDGDLRTMWESGALTGPVGQWIRVSLDHQVDLGVVSVAFADSPVIGPPVTQVLVSTQAGTLTERVRRTGSFQFLRVPAGMTSWLRIRVTRTARQGGPGTQVGIAAISIPGVSASRTIVAPDVRPAGGNPPAYVLAKAGPSWPGCMLTSLRWVCAPSLERTTEEQYGFDHSFTAAHAQTMTLTGTAVLTSTALIERYAWIGKAQPHVRASSTYTTDPQDQPQSAFDGDPATSWISGATDTKPALRISWSVPRLVGEVTISRPPGAAEPVQVQLTGSSGGQIRGGWIVGPAGRLTFSPMRTRSLVLRFTPSSLPLQVTDVTIPGVHPLNPAGALPFRLSCGLGPVIQMNGTAVRTRVSGSFSALLTGRPVRFSACGPVAAAAGLNRVIEPSRDGFDVQTVVLDQPGPAGLRATSAAVQPPARVIRWGPVSRAVRVSAGRVSYLVVSQNYNSGWQATLGGRVLRPVRLDGWRQGWLLRPGMAGLVTMTYLPDARYRISLFGGLGALGLVLLAAIILPARPRRRPAGRGTRRRRGVHAQPWPGRRLSRAWPAAARLAGIGALAGLGLWAGGYPGALIFPAAVAAFLAVLPPRDRPALAPLASPWLVAGLLLAVSLLGVLGQHLPRSTQPGPLATMLSSTLPQAVALIIVARLLAGLITPGERATTGQPGSALPDDASPEHSGSSRAKAGTGGQRKGGPFDEVVAERGYGAGEGGYRQEDGHGDEHRGRPALQGAPEVEQTEEQCDSDALPEEDSV